MLTSASHTLLLLHLGCSYHMPLSPPDSAGNAPERTPGQSHLPLVVWSALNSGGAVMASRPSVGAVLAEDPPPPAANCPLRTGGGSSSGGGSSCGGDSRSEVGCCRCRHGRVLQARVGGSGLSRARSPLAPLCGWGDPERTREPRGGGEDERRPRAGRGTRHAGRGGAPTTRRVLPLLPTATAVVCSCSTRGELRRTSLRRTSLRRTRSAGRRSRRAGSLRAARGPHRRSGASRARAE